MLKHPIRSLAFFLLLALGTTLLGLNIYGLSQDIRVLPVTNQDLRFPNDQAIPFDELLKNIDKQDQEPPLAYAQRLNKLVSKGLAHIHWESLEPDAFNMRIPFWENYILAAMGHFSGIPEFEKYHYINPLRSLERGIGICGDASMVFSQLLDQAGISNQIISFPGHVMVSVHINGKSRVFDPDFGLDLKLSQEEMILLGPDIGSIYTPEFGHKEGEIMSRVLYNPIREWDNVRDFVTKKFYFEKLAYFLKWPLPITMIFVALILPRVGNRTDKLR